MSNFVGSYVQTMKEVLVTSMLSGQHALVLGAPGWGKTAISRSVAQALTGGAYSFTRLDPSTPPDVVRGAYNPKALLDGRLERVVTGTPYDPAVKLSILDEMGRANEVTFDALLDTLDRQDIAIAPPVWATSNFMPTNERIAALIDRFALWHWVKVSPLDVCGIVAAQLGNGQGGPVVDSAGLPTVEEIAAIHSARPGPNAIAVIGQLLQELANEMQKEGLRVHPRRASQWSRILYYVSVWKSGTADFTTIPDFAARMLRFAWPCVTQDEADKWAKIAGAVVDTIGAAIEEALAGVASKIKETTAEKDAMKRTNMVMGLASFIQDAQAGLKKLAGENDPRTVGATTQMNKWLADALNGREIE